jgi:large subunit ribosomal protein L22
MEAKAVAKYVGISPRKARLIADIMQGKRVEEALAMLKLSPTPAARAVAKVIKSAAANAESNFEVLPSELRVVKVFVDQGPTLKRVRPQARGRANLILRRFSHITAVVGEEE